MPGRTTRSDRNKHRERSLSHVGSTLSATPCSCVRCGRTRRGRIVRTLCRCRSASGPTTSGLSRQARRDAASAVSRRRRSRTPSGPWTTTSESSTRALSSSEAEQTSRVGQARRRAAPRRPRTPRRRRGRRRRRRTAGVELLDERADRDALVHAAASAPRSRCGRARRPGRGARRARASAAAAVRTPPSGSSSRRVCTATARPFSSTQASAASAARSSRGSSRLNVARPRGGRGEITRRLVEVQRSLPYWPKHEQLAPALADRVADLLEPAEGQRLAGRAAGDDRDRAHLLGQLDQDLGRVGVDVGRARGRRRSAARVPSKSRPTTTSAAARPGRRTAARPRRR